MLFEHAFELVGLVTQFFRLSYGISQQLGKGFVLTQIHDDKLRLQKEWEKRIGLGL
jgi:hypothetical protein